MRRPLAITDLRFMPGERALRKDGVLGWVRPVISRRRNCVVVFEPAAGDQCRLSRQADQPSPGAVIDERGAS